MTYDVDSPIDLRDIADAREWEATAMGKRPWRIEFFECFARQLAGLQNCESRVLELGSGPGFLARYLLSGQPSLAYTALDFSAAMHELARDRLGADAAQVTFVEQSFRDPNWVHAVDVFDAAITMQSVHELRHKRHAVRLHEQVRSVLTPEGIYLVCDHYVGEGGMRNTDLFMSVDEQQRALLAAGFQQVRSLMTQRGLVLHEARQVATP